MARHRGVFEKRVKYQIQHVMDTTYCLVWVAVIQLFNILEFFYHFESTSFVCNPSEWKFHNFMRQQKGNRTGGVSLWEQVYFTLTVEKTWKEDTTKLGITKKQICYAAENICRMFSI